MQAQVSAAIAELAARVRESVVQVVSGERGAGAGVIWQANGGILTNHHVVAEQGAIRVLLADGRQLPATVVSHNAALDLAMLRVEATELPAALVDDSSALRVGELVFAIGHPWGQRDVLTMGIVSGLGTMTVARTGREAPYIRSDVRLAPGNSGGPLLNARGAVVGINAMIFGGDLSVAIPSHVASEWVAGFPSRRVALGVAVEAVELPPQLRQGAWAARAAALLVTSVPLDRAGPPVLLVGDVLLDVAGEAVTDTEALRHALGRRRVQEQVRLHILRGGALWELEVEVGALEQAL